MTDITKLTGLFDLLCDDFKKMMDEGTMTPSDRKTLITFLEQNNINCDGNLNTKVQDLLKDLPFEEDEEQLHQTH